MKLFLPLLIGTVCAFGQYKLEPAGAPPADLPSTLAPAGLAKEGVKITGLSGTVAEIWFRTSVPSAANGEQNVTFSNVAHGTLLGVIRFPEKATDRRGQPLKPGLYTLRFSYYPVDGAHQGVAPTRDFAILVPAADDKDPNSTPKFDELMAMSRKASGTQHPAVLNVWKPDETGPQSLKQEGDDWVLYSTIGDRPIAMIVVGTYKS